MFGYWYIMGLCKIYLRRLIWRSVNQYWYINIVWFDLVPFMFDVFYTVRTRLPPAPWRNMEISHLPLYLDDVGVLYLQTNSCKLMNKSLHIRHECRSALCDTAVGSRIVTDCCLVYTECCILFSDTNKEAAVNVYQFDICIEIYKK
jgi:hypothetical protein